VQRRRLALGWGTAIVSAGLLFAGLPASPASAATTVLASWQMNEKPGSHVLVDSSGHGLNGTMGSEVALTGTTEKFAFLKPNTPPPHPGHVDSVSSPLLNPGSASYSITLRLRWANAFGNIIQKGQSSAKGGYFKLQAPNGIVQCLFRGSLGNAGVGSGRALNDGGWHTITCARTSTGLSMTVDGVVTGRKNGPTGTISNTSPLSIAGKLTCDQVKVTCDYWAGEIDYVTIQTG
jgi:Concanavalin A-like lectin/glucanases superfamily